MVPAPAAAMWLPREHSFHHPQSRASSSTNREASTNACSWPSSCAALTPFSSFSTMRICSRVYAHNTQRT